MVGSGRTSRDRIITVGILIRIISPVRGVSNGDGLPEVTLPRLLLAPQNISTVGVNTEAWTDRLDSETHGKFRAVTTLQPFLFAPESAHKGLHFTVFNAP